MQRRHPPGARRRLLIPVKRYLYGTTGVFKRCGASRTGCRNIKRKRCGGNRSNGHKVWRDKIVFREHCHALGVRVTVADISDRLMPMMDGELSGRMDDLFRKYSI